MEFFSPFCRGKKKKQICNFYLLLIILKPLIKIKCIHEIYGIAFGIIGILEILELPFELIPIDISDF